MNPLQTIKVVKMKKIMLIASAMVLFSGCSLVETVVDRKVEKLQEKLEDKRCSALTNKVDRLEKRIEILEER